MKTVKVAMVCPFQKDVVSAMSEDHLFAASIAQQSFFEQICHSSSTKDARMFFLNDERVKHADSDIALWMPDSSSKMFNEPDKCNDHFVFKNLMEEEQD